MILNLADRDLNDHFEPSQQPKKNRPGHQGELCYVVLDYEPEMASSALLSYSTEMYMYTLSDSQFITIDNEQFRGCTPYIFP